MHYAELALAIPPSSHDDASNKNHLNNHLNKLPPPPAYNYFDEPTIYAQIDHGGSYKAPPGPGGPAGPPSSVTGGGVGSYPLISPVSQQSLSQRQQSPLTLQLQQDSTQQHHHHMQQQQQQQPHTPHTPTTAALLQLQHPIQPLPPPTSTLQHSPHSVPLPLQSPSLSTTATSTNGSSKQYLREIVTTRTPLAFSQQESCV